MLLAAAGVACGATPSPATELPRSTASARLLSYERSGGFAGRSATLTVGRRGRVVARPGGRVLNLGTGELRRLRADLARADLATLPAVNRPVNPVNDGFTYVFVAQGRRVVAATGAVPRRLEPLLSRCDRLLRRAGVP